MNFVFLFGSIVLGKMTFRSDIEIGVEFDKVSLQEATLFRKRILGNINSKVDVQVYNVLPEKIKKEINKKGMILYERKNKREDK